MRSRRRLGRALQAAAILACAFLVLAAAPALAKKKHKKHKAAGNPLVTVAAAGNTATNPGVISDATASCPAGTVVLGGGFSAPFNASGQLVVYQSYRSSPSAWSASAVNSAGAGAVTAYAYCRKTSHPITDVVATGTVASGEGENSQVEADCPAGAAAINGGFQTTLGPGANQFLIPEWSIGGGPTPGGTPATGYWHVAAQNSSAGAHTITAHVYCMAGIGLPGLHQDQGSLSVGPLGSLTERSAPTCPSTPKPKKKKKGKKKRKPRARPTLSSGAFYSPFVPGGPVVPVHTESRIDAGAWIDTAVNGGSGSGTLTVQSQAFCF
jgi:hypothetical protein